LYDACTPGFDWRGFDRIIRNERALVLPDRRGYQIGMLGNRYRYWRFGQNRRPAPALFEDGLLCPRPPCTECGRLERQRPDIGKKRPLISAREPLDGSVER
jgi:hypothetical protein